MSLAISLNPKTSLNPSSPFHFSSNPKRLNLSLNCCKSPIQNPNSRHFNDSLSRTFRTLGSLQPYVLSNRRQILSAWLCSIISVSSLSVIVSDLGKLGSLVGGGFDGAVGLRNDVLGLGFLVLARILGDYWRQALLWEASLRAACDIRVKVFRYVLESDLGVDGGRNNGISAGDVAFRITAEASDVADTVYSVLNTTVPSILQLSAMARQMLTISPVLSLISATMIPFTALFIAYLGEELRKISKNANLTVAALSTYLNEILPAIPFVKADNAEEWENTRFQRLVQADYQARLRKKKMKVLIPQIVKIIYFGSSFLFFVSLLGISRASFDGRRMVSFITSLFFLVEPIQDIGKAYNELKQGEPAIERLFDLTKFESKIKDKPNAIDLSHVTGEVRFCDVSFKYGDSLPLVFSELNLHIKAGETVALVGLSGGGKSTLAKLLVRLFDPFSGSIFIDSHNVIDIRLKSLRRHIGLVSQDIVGTVAENIGYRDLMKGIDMDRVENVARIANAEEFIRQLPNGYETEVGPRGSTFSGGQRQRLAIARALYHDPSILILDEATSALDSKSESLVREALERLMENRTVVVITHRLETVKMANRVFLLENGNLKELCRSTLLSDQLKPLLSKGVLI